VSPEKTALILLGHGARDPEWAATLTSVRDKMRAAGSVGRVELAFLSFIPPDLPTQVAQLERAGITAITVLPMFIAQGKHLKRELPGLIDKLQSTHPALELWLAPAIGSSDLVLAAMATQACHYLRHP
jgi:sirohydrochlorin cobaltochelatase